jgi:hypothetical protein
MGSISRSNVKVSFQHSFILPIDGFNLKLNARYRKSLINVHCSLTKLYSIVEENPLEIINFILIKHFLNDTKKR